MAGLGGNRRGGFGGPLVEGALLGSMMAGGMGGRGPTKAIQMNENYNYPIVALKALTVYQPRDYSFALEERDLFDISKYPKGIKVLNGDISEDAAKYQAKTLVEQVQSQKAHAKYHMIQQMSSDEDVLDAELLHAPIWFVRYDYKGNQIVLVLDANSGNVINSLGSSAHLSFSQPYKIGKKQYCCQDNCWKNSRGPWISVVHGTTVEVMGRLRVCSVSVSGGR